MPGTLLAIDIPFVISCISWRPHSSIYWVLAMCQAFCWSFVTMVYFTEEETHLRISLRAYCDKLQWAHLTPVLCHSWGNISSNEKNLRVSYHDIGEKQVIFPCWGMIRADTTDTFWLTSFFCQMWEALWWWNVGSIPYLPTLGVFFAVCSGPVIIRLSLHYHSDSY